MPKNKTSVAAVIPNAWPKIIEQRKTILGWPQWSPVAALPPEKDVRTSRADLNTVAAETTQALFGLADEHGTGLEGVRLRLSAWAYRRQRDVTATLEVPGGRSFITISRIDAWPSDPHHNSHKVRKTPGLKTLPALVEESHIHRFEDNAKCGIGAFGAGPEGNLPAAVPFPNNLQSFREFLRSVGTEFNIEGLVEFPSPEGWQGLI
jgi:hypothetical protein